MKKIIILGKFAYVFLFLVCLAVMALPVSGIIAFDQNEKIAAFIFGLLNAIVFAELAFKKK